MDIKIPEVGESITEGTISTWLKKEGDPVKFGDVLLELETDKVNLEINSESDGILQKVLKQEGDTVQVGETVGVIVAASGQQPAKPIQGDNGQSAAQAKQQPTAQPADTQQQPAAAANQENVAPAVPSVGGNVTAPPSVRKLARERGIDLNQVQPHPLHGGRITREDVEAAQPPQTAPKTTGQGNNPDSAKPVERVRMSRRRQTIAKRLVQAQQTAAMLTTFNEVDMTAILDIRRRRKQAFQEKHNVGLGFMSFFTKAVVGALKMFPLLNAEIDGEDILVKKYYDIGIAVSTEGGLVVPVVRDADRASFADIERNIGDLAAKARNNSLSLSDLQGGTFTITNGGIFGSLFSTPILNSPQVGILGMHTIQKRPVAIDDDRMENRPMMYIALSYDHRIVDGSEAVQFLATVKRLLEDPESLLLEG